MNISINSDYTDFYDSLAYKDSTIIYNRFLSNSMQRGKALKFLNNIGIKTLEIKQADKFYGNDEKIVVYTNPKGHGGNGKKIMTVSDAIITYPNCLASHYYEESDITVKYLQIGKRRLTLTFKKYDKYSLDIGKLIDIKEIPSEYNRLIGLPIFSIDYICYNNEMIATDFNEVENLHKINIDKYISADDVIKEIIESLMIYNKI